MALLIGIFIGVIVLLLLLIGVIHTMGSSLPETHTAASTIALSQPPEAVYDALADVPGYARWIPGTSVLELPSDDADRPVYRQTMGRNSFVVRRTTADRPRTLRFTIEDDSKFFSGDWTYTIEPAGGGSKVTLTENGRVPHAIPRFFMKYIFGTKGYIRKQLANLAKRFGESAQPS